MCSLLRTFGYICFVLLPSIERIKLSPRSAMCVFFGYNSEHKGYRCYDPVSRRLRISHHVTFLEDTSYYSSSSQDLLFMQRPDPLPSQRPDPLPSQDSVSFSIVLPGVVPFLIPPPPASSVSV